MSGGDLAVLGVAALALIGTVLSAVFGYKAQIKNTQVNEQAQKQTADAAASAVAAEFYDELVRNQGIRIVHLEGREKQMEERLSELSRELSETRRMLNKALEGLDEADKKLTAAEAEIKRLQNEADPDTQ